MKWKTAVVRCRWWWLVFGHSWCLFEADVTVSPEPSFNNCVIPCWSWNNMNMFVQFSTLLRLILWLHMFFKGLVVSNYFCLLADTDFFFFCKLGPNFSEFISIEWCKMILFSANAVYTYIYVFFFLVPTTYVHCTMHILLINICHGQHCIHIALWKLLFHFRMFC